MNNTRKAGIGGLIACLIGAVLFGLIGISDQKFVKNCQTTPGQITEVVKKTTTERDKNSKSYRTKKKVRYHVTYTYNVDGKEYTERETMHHAVDVGPTTVFYLPGDPDDAKLSKPSPMVVFLVAVGCLVGAGFAGFKTLTGASG